MDATQRFEFFEFVRDRWGPDRAGQLMDLLPPAGASELVTTDQFRREMSELDRKWTERIEALDNKMTEGFAAQDNKWTDRIHALDNKWTERTDALDNKWTERLGALDNKMTEGFADQDRKNADLAGRIAEQTRLIMFSMMALWASGIALALAAARLG